MGGDVCVLIVITVKSLLINKAVQDIGMGRYNWQLFILCGFGWFADKYVLLLVHDIELYSSKILMLTNLSSLWMQVCSRGKPQTCPLLPPTQIIVH